MSDGHLRVNLNLSQHQFSYPCPWHLSGLATCPSSPWPSLPHPTLSHPCLGLLGMWPQVSLSCHLPCPLEASSCTWYSSGLSATALRSATGNPPAQPSSSIPCPIQALVTRGSILLAYLVVCIMDPSPRGSPLRTTDLCRTNTPGNRFPHPPGKQAGQKVERNRGWSVCLPTELPPMPPCHPLLVPLSLPPR